LVVIERQLALELRGKSLLQPFELIARDCAYHRVSALVGHDRSDLSPGARGQPLR
jgi:hypothetical protein